MKLKIFKKKIETVLFKRLCEEKKYIIFFSGIKSNVVNSNFSNILNYSLKYSLQNYFNQSLTNNFLKSSVFSSLEDFTLFLKNLKLNTNLIYFIKINNLYFFNFSSDFEKKFNNFNINAYTFLVRLQKILFNWIPLLKVVVKDSTVNK
jgi:hypothetical protein